MPNRIILLKRLISIRIRSRDLGQLILEKQCLVGIGGETIRPQCILRNGSRVTFFSGNGLFSLALEVASNSLQVFYTFWQLFNLKNKTL